MIYLSLFFVIFSIVVIIFLCKEEKVDKVSLFVWSAVLVVWSNTFYKCIEKYL